MCVRLNAQKGEGRTKESRKERGDKRGERRRRSRCYYLYRYVSVVENGERETEWWQTNYRISERKGKGNGREEMQADSCVHFQNLTLLTKSTFGGASYAG